MIIDQSLDLNPKEELWDVVEREIHSMTITVRSVEIVSCNPVNMDRNLTEKLVGSGIHATKS